MKQKAASRAVHNYSYQRAQDNHSGFREALAKQLVVVAADRITNGVSHRPPEQKGGILDSKGETAGPARCQNSFF